MSDKNFSDSVVGDRVRVSVPQVDKDKTEARNILVCVVEVTSDQFFKLGTQKSILSVVARAIFRFVGRA